jgi:hypothetical protein
LIPPNKKKHSVLLRHTHIDIDGRNAIYSSHLYGRKEAGGRVDRVNTFSQFDQEVAKSYLTDTFYIKRMVGPLNVKASWNKWLAYSRYGSARTTSSEALAQGGRQEEPMCINFYIGKQPRTLGKTLMRYKFRENDKYWAPYEHEGIPCFSDSAPHTIVDLLRHPGIRSPDPWPEMATIESYLTSSLRLKPQEREEWRQFFANVPTCQEEYTEQQLFPWLLPYLVERSKQANQPCPGADLDIGDTARPDKLDERVLWSGYTPADARRDAKARAANFQRQQEALGARLESEKVRKSQMQGTVLALGSSKSRRVQAVADDDDDDDDDSSDEEVLAVGDMGVIRVGDVVVVSPDNESREQDRTSGYHLGLNLGRVCELDIAKKRVNLWWFFSTQKNWNAKTMTFIHWREKKTNVSYNDWVDVEYLIQDTWGTLLKLELRRTSGREGFGQYTLAKESQARVQEVLRDNDAS